MKLGLEHKDKDFSKFRHIIVDSGLLARLSNAAIRVYLVILRHANYETGLSVPTVKTISKESGVNKNCIFKATRELVLNGLIDKSRAPKRFAFRNCYRIIKHPRIRPDIVPKNTDKKENLEILKNRDKVLDAAGSAPARPNGQAEPAVNSKKSLKDFTKEELQGFIKGVGLDRVKKYLGRIGYDEKEIENLNEAEGAKGAK